MKAESAEEGPPLLGTIPRYKWKYACIFQGIHRDEAHEPTSENYQESKMNHADHIGSVKKSATLAQAMLVRFKFLPTHPQPNMTLLLRTTGR